VGSGFQERGGITRAFLPENAYTADCPNSLPRTQDQANGPIITTTKIGSTEEQTCGK
jgi:hypothetical protein